MKVLVTGGAGFIGSNLVQELAANDRVEKIYILDLLTYAGNLSNLSGSNTEKYKIVIGDVANAQLINSIISDVDFVYHLAAETHVTRSIYDNYQFFYTDVMGTQAVCNATLRCSSRENRIIPFIHISTSEVYGTAQSAKMDELHPLNPCSPYAAAKAGADRLVYSYGKTYDMASLIIRPFNQFGPRQHPEKLIPRFITSCIDNEPMHIHGDGSAARDWTHVSDTVRWLCSLIDQDISKYKAEVFNIGAGVSHDINHIARQVASQFPTCSSANVSERPGQVNRHTCDCSKAKSLLQWRPSRTLDESIPDLVSWYKNNETKWRPQLLVKDIEIEVTPGNYIPH